MAQPDVSIYQNLLRPGPSAFDYAAEADKRESNKLALEQGRMNLLSAQRAQDDDQALRGLYSGGIDPYSDEGVAAALRISPKAGFEAIKGRNDANKAKADLAHVQAQTANQQADAQKNTIAAAGDKLKQFRGALDYVDTPDGAARWLKAQYDDPLTAGQMQALGPYEEAVKRIPRDPGQFQQWRQKAGLGMEKHLEMLQKQATLDETARHDRTTEGTAAGQLKVAQDRLSYDQGQPKGVVVQTDAGPVLADPRTAVGTPVTVGGKPVGNKLTAVPASANTAMITNSQNLSNLDTAIKLLEGKDVGEMKGDKAATGWKGFMPGSVLNRVDPKGVDARAALADFGSMVLHDRSGAAVTASEYPRLMPFVPQATDDNATALKKLKRFKQIVEQEQSSLKEAYGPGAGYKGRQGGATGEWDSGDIHSQADAILRGGN